MNRIVLGTLGLLAALLVNFVPANASVIIQIQSVDAASGSTNNELDVSLTNSGPDSLTVAGFSFEISTATSNIEFTSADFAPLVAPYIFSGVSFDQDISSSLNTSSGQILDASDFFDGAGGVSIASGGTVGLGAVFFSVAPGTSAGPITVGLTGYPSTSLSDPTGTNIPVGQFNSGSINISTTPEPATALLLGSAVSLLGLLRRRR